MFIFVFSFRCSWNILRCSLDFVELWLRRHMVCILVSTGRAGEGKRELGRREKRAREKGREEEREGSSNKRG